MAANKDANCEAGPHFELINVFKLLTACFVQLCLCSVFVFPSHSYSSTQFRPIRVAGGDYKSYYLK